MMGWMRSLAAAALVCCAPAALAQHPKAATEEAVMVTGRLPGPRLWVVSDADSDVWILGATTYLPKGVTWDTTRVEGVLARVQRVVTPVWIRLKALEAIDLFLTDRDLFRLPKRQTLQDVLEPALFSRFEAARESLGEPASKYRRLRPAIAGARLVGAAYNAAGLDSGRAPEETVRKLAWKRNLKVSAVRTYRARAIIDQLPQLSPAADSACLEAALDAIVQDVPRVRAVAAAWAVGDMETLRATPENAALRRCEIELAASAGSVDEVLKGVRRGYLEAVEQGLAEPGGLLVVLPMTQALGRDGLIEALRRRGLEVDGP